MRVDPDEYRRAVGRFATGVTVVTTVADGRHFALTANSFTSVSLEPLLVLVGIQKTSRFHAEVLASGVWGISVLAADMQEASRFFASGERYDAQNPFDGWRCGPGSETKVMLLDGAIACFECRTVLSYEGGDHTLLLGEVLALDASRPDAAPLLYYDGGYRALR
jgi:flavin reductase (DIM6/NTAB) family NADH-FMN oxidoreductase RutF